MRGFREHFLSKYFGYRRRYVDYFLREAPQRARLAVLAETVRLGFMVAGNLLCALIFWTLAAGAANRFGFDSRTMSFAALALVPTGFAALALRGLGAALADRRRVGTASLERGS